MRQKQPALLVRRALCAMRLFFQSKQFSGEVITTRTFYENRIEKQKKKNKEVENIRKFKSGSYQPKLLAWGATS